MNSVLVFRSASLGDFILSSPALAEVRKNFPGKHVVLLTTQSSHQQQREKVALFAGDEKSSPWVEMAVPHLIDEYLTFGNITDIRSLWALRRKLRAFQFEAVILMMDPCAPRLGRLKKLLLLFFLVGYVPLLGWRGSGSLHGNLHKLKQGGFLRHHVHGPLQFLAEMKPPHKYKDEDLVFDLRPGRDAEAWASKWVFENQLGQRILVAIAPGSLQPHKRWPEEAFKELLTRILAKYANVSVVVLGTPGDKPLGEILAKVSPGRVFNLAGATSITQSAALLRLCRLLVGNDGGAVHLADAMGCKVVSIIPGIEYPDSIEPWHNQELAVRHPVPCAPCYSFTHCPEGHNNCMKELPVDQVFKKCEEVLGVKSGVL